MVCPTATFILPTGLRSRRDDWASNTSPNKHVKLYVGSPASQAAGNYYVDAAQMGTIIAATRQNYSSFGGVMLWDAGNARGTSHRPALRPRRVTVGSMLSSDFRPIPDNGNFDKQMKNFLMKGAGAPPSPTSAVRVSTDIPTSAAAASSSTRSTATDTDGEQPTGTTDFNPTGTDGGETTSRGKHKTSSGFETSRVSATATAGNTCHTHSEE